MPAEIRYSRVVHLSHVIGPQIPLWPGDAPVRFRDVATHERDGYALRQFSIGEHSGTHANAARSFDPSGPSVDGYAPESLVAPAAVIDVRPQVAADADYLLTLEDLLTWESKHGPVPEGSLVILYTGWQQRWPDPAAFLDADSEGTMHFPGFGPDATRLLLEQRRAGGLAIDTHGLDGGRDPSFPVNKLIARHRRLAIENLTNLDQLPPTGATVIVGILRLADGTGSPAAILALVL